MNNHSLSVLFGVSALLLAVACGSSTQERCTGAERCDCYGNGTCDEGLICRSNACVVAAGGGAGISGAGGVQTLPGTGGKMSGTGGAVVLPPAPSPNCTDVAAASYTLNQAGGRGIVAVAGSDKQYIVQANWWKLYNQQTMTVSGLSFAIGNPAGSSSSDNDPMGYPSLFIGSYAGVTSKGSNLPKQVSALTKVNTVFSTNAGTMGTSNYNAAYDVWFTSGSSPIPDKQYTPGSGGAYLMVWLFNPSNRQPRGRKAYAGHSVSGLPGSWDVWIDSTDPTCISYVSTTARDTLDFDLNYFIQDSVTNRYGITSSMYLSIVFAGFEIWGGGNGLQAKAFCANVL